MRQSDVQIGVEYAVADRYGDRVARVRPTAAPKGGQVEADVLEMPEGSRVEGVTLSGGSDRCVVSTRHIFGTWDEWLVEAGRRKAEAERRVAERRRYEASLKDLTTVDSARLVPSEYSIEPWFGEDVRWDNTSRAATQRLGEAASVGWRGSSQVERVLEAAALFKDLPAPLCRDLIAAMEDRESWHVGVRDAEREASVRVVLARAARILDSLRRVTEGVVSPDGFLVDRDVAFVRAVVADVESRGGRLPLPLVPPLPKFPAHTWRSGDGSEAACALLGWVRVGIAATGGQKMHAVDCQHVSRSESGQKPESRPWWQVRMAPSRGFCGTCGGPKVAAPLEVAHFVAASDVWAARGRGAVEPWQRVALVRLTNATAEEAVRLGEGIPSVDVLVAQALAKDLPGEEGSDGYEVVTSFIYGVTGQGLRHLDEPRAVALARERLEVARRALPDSSGLSELPLVPTVQQLRDRRHDLERQVLDGCLDKYLFGLENMY